MAIGSPEVIRSLVKFLSDEISEKNIEYFVPLESKGALLMDSAMEKFPNDLVRPEVLYLRSLEYLTKEVRKRAIFGVFDDFAFSGRTIARAIEEMCNLGIPRAHIHPMAFFRFQRQEVNEEVRLDILAATATPGDGTLLQLSQDEILRDVQTLAIEHKIPASYDNLDWDVSISEADYIRLMRDLAKTGWFLHYGQRGKLDASALLVRAASKRSFSVFPKIRFWYDKSKLLLHIAPISFAKRQQGGLDRRCARLKKILTPEQPTRYQLSFATYQADAITEQIAILGYLKPYFRKYNLSPQLNQKHIGRYFGPRASQVVQYLREGYQSTPELSIELPLTVIGRYLDFYWIAVEIMRLLSQAYWSQHHIRKERQGFTVSEIIEQFSIVASAETVHAAIDYCADMNLIATFFRWNGYTPSRAFRLTENGEMEVGRNDGVHCGRLTFIEKLGALILYKSEKQEAYWWVLEKIPAILIRRLGFKFPQLEATMDHFGDMTLLHPRERSEYSITWPKLRTVMWDIRKGRGTGDGSKSIKFVLSTNNFEAYREDILGDPEIVKAIGPIETLLELIRNKMMGHNVAIFLDILSDGSSGATYLANSLQKAIDLIGYREHLTDINEQQSVSQQINNWLLGLDEKTRLLVVERTQLLEHMSKVVKVLSRQKRGEIADHLVRSVPFPEGNRIIPAFMNLSSLVKRLDDAMKYMNYEEILEIRREIVLPGRTITQDDETETAFEDIAQAICRWAAALSGAPQDDDVYGEAQLSVAEGEVRRMYIVAYDLIGSSGEQYASRRGADRNRHIQSVISNWIMAFGGYTMRHEFGAGDLGFGFFYSVKSAVQASLWATYHLDLLKRTNQLLKQDMPHAGFGIVGDELRSGFRKQVKSDWLSKFSKAWKHEAERIADSAGRHGRPIIAIHDDMYSGISELPSDWLGIEAKLDSISVRFIKRNAISVLPWKI